MKNFYFLFLLALGLLTLPVSAQEALTPGTPLANPVEYRGGGDVSITHSASTTIEGGGVACANSAGGYTTDNQYLRVFDLSEFPAVTSGFNVMSVDIGVGTNVSPIDVDTEVNLYTMEGGVDFSATFDRSTLTNVGSASFTLRSIDEAGVYSVDITTMDPLAPTDTLVVEWAVPSGETDIFNIRYGQNDDGQTGATYIATDLLDGGTSCGPLPPTDVAQLGDFGALQWVLVVNGSLAVANEGGSELPTTVSLGDGYPNPFNPTATVPFEVSEASDLRLVAYDALGREVAVLAQGSYVPGAYTATFEANGLPSGPYLIRLEAGGAVQSRTITLLK